MTERNVKYDLANEPLLAHARADLQLVKIAHVFNAVCALFVSDLTKDKVRLRKAVINATSVFDNKEQGLLGLPKSVQARITDAMKLA